MKEFVFYYVLLIFLVNVRVIPLKDKKGTTITNAFQKILDESNRKPDKIWANKRSECYIILMKS